MKKVRINLRFIDLDDATIQADYGKKWTSPDDICFETKSGIRIFLDQSMKSNPMECYEGKEVEFDVNEYGFAMNIKEL